MRQAADFVNGQVLLVDKPLHWSSFQAVNKIKWLLKKQFDLKKIKVGHAGTLDPLATGLLLICTGKSTKTIQSLQNQTKEYTGTFYLGATTPSFDLETDIDQRFDIGHITNDAIAKITHEFVGDIWQRPPIFSAIKKDGKRLYEHARAGSTVAIEPRKVTVFAFEITRVAVPEIDFIITCSKGTYIRSIAHDFGLALQAGAHLTALRRTKIGEFEVGNAMQLSDEMFTGYG